MLTPMVGYEVRQVPATSKSSRYLPQLIPNQTNNADHRKRCLPRRCAKSAQSAP